MKNLKINQTCLYTIKDFENNPKFRKGKNNPGVYLWGFSLENEDFKIPCSIDNFFPFYVGKVQEKGCLYNRTQEHLASMIGGNMPIFDFNNTIKSIGKTHREYQKISSAKKNNNDVGPLLPNSDFPDLLHFPEGIHRMYEFVTNDIIQLQVDWMVKHFCITFFTLENYDKRDIIDLEKFIGNMVGYDRLITKPYTKPNIEVQILDSTEEIIVKKYEDLFVHIRGQIGLSKYGI